jgi:hypothetical protein
MYLDAPQVPQFSKQDAKAQAAAAKAYAKAQRNWFGRHKILTGIGALFVVGAIGGGISGAGGSHVKPIASTAPATGDAGSTSQSVQAAPATAAVTTPSMTTGEKNALGSAKQYLSISAFSRKGLIQQLSSAAGDGYSVADATFAADNSGANWDTEAAQAAKQYLSISSFSYNGLVQQLSSSAGDGYTLAQAQYGAHSAGLS